MGAFFHFARRLLDRPARLLWTLLFATVSAAGLGIGLLSLVPILKLILGEGGKSLQALAADFNAKDPWMRVPTEVVERLPTDAFAGVLWILCGVGVLTILGAAANFLHQASSFSLCTEVVARIRLDVFRHAMRLPLREVMRLGPAECSSRVIRDTSELVGGFMTLTGKATAQITKAIAAFAAAVVIDWRVVLVAAVAGPIFGVVLRKSGKRVRRGNKGALMQQAVLLRVTTEALSGLRMVKTSTAESAMTGRFRRANDGVVRESLRARVAQSLAGPLIETLTILTALALAAFAVREILRGTLSFDRFVLSLGSLAVAAASIRPLVSFAIDIQAAGAAADRLKEMLALHEEPRRAEALLRLPRHRSKLSFEQVSFTYPGAEEPALDGVTLDINFGEHVAFVGPNGCGKTTLLSMLPRLLDPSSGRIRIDGIDIAQTTIGSVRRQIGVVTQESILIQGSVAENISLGMPGIQRDQLVDAARRAHAESFVLRLAGGLDGAISEQGASLSGGQRQRLAIARALLRDPAILILDEATSQIDAESEQQIGQALAEISHSRTTITVAHRLSTMLSADRIVVMDKGRVVDVGTHPQLLDRCGVYQRLVSSQMQAREAAAT
jgi:ABC-type multidrug transport system fused ATPase/permease subunit